MSFTPPPEFDIREKLASMPLRHKHVLSMAQAKYAPHLSRQIEIALEIFTKLEIRSAILERIAIVHDVYRYKGELDEDLKARLIVRLCLREHAADRSAKSVATS